jgi:hypothetical protein
MYHVTIDINKDIPESFSSLKRNTNILNEFEVNKIDTDRPDRKINDAPMN